MRAMALRNLLFRQVRWRFGMNRQSRGLSKRRRRVGYAAEHSPSRRVSAETTVQIIDCQRKHTATGTRGRYTIREPAEPADNLIVGDAGLGDFHS